MVAGNVGKRALFGKQSEREYLMKLIAIVAICAGLFALQFVQGAESNKVDKLSKPGIIEMTDVTVLKVFSAKDGGAKYKAYLVQWKNQEVVVTDMFGSEFKKGDTMKIMVMVITPPGLGISLLQFTTLDMVSLDAALSKRRDARSGSTISPLFEAVQAGDVIRVKSLLAKGADVNAKDELLGLTPLHAAALMGSKEIVEVLLANKADVNAKSKDGLTPVEAAIAHKDIQEIIQNYLAKTGQGQK